MSDYNNYVPQAECPNACGAECVAADVTGQQDPAQQRIARMFVNAADVEYTPPKWLIKPYVQIGKGTLIQADPGTGKTAFACAVAAAVTTGGAICGLPVEIPGDVLMLSVEDDLGVLRGRIEANGGDVSRVHFLTGASQLRMDSPEIEDAIKMYHAKLVIFDPLQAFLGAKVDMFRANETRPVLSRLFATCARNDCACVIIAHDAPLKPGDLRCFMDARGQVPVVQPAKHAVGIGAQPVSDVFEFTHGFLPFYKSIVCTNT